MHSATDFALRSFSTAFIFGCECRFSRKKSRARNRSPKCSDAVWCGKNAIVQSIVHAVASDLCFGFSVYSVCESVFRCIRFAFWFLNVPLLLESRVVCDAANCRYAETEVIKTKKSARAKSRREKRKCMLRTEYSLSVYQRMWYCCLRRRSNAVTASNVLARAIHCKRLCFIATN